MAENMAKELENQLRDGKLTSLLPIEGFVITDFSKEKNIFLRAFLVFMILKKIFRI